MATCKLALALGLSTWLWLPGIAVAAEPSEEQSEAQPQIITPEEFLEDVLGLIERYSQHGSGDDEAEGQWRHAPPLEDDDAPSEDDDSWHYDDDPWQPAPPLEDDDTPSEDDDS